MKPFTQLTSIAAPLRMRNVDTDIIIPKQFLRTIKRSGLGVHAFNDIRYNADGSPKADFVLNDARYKGAEILIAGDNFGCGSSREHAPWALADMGYRCVIAPSFADIFRNNCFQNGMLPVQLTETQVDALFAYAEKTPQTPLTVDLQAGTVTGEGLAPISFTLDPFRRHCLLNGLDDIGLTLEKSEAIAAFEAKDRQARAFLYQQD
jgi:3-isopropylmalate/(R)-2-methylmalate dehydratase small subunit